MIQLNNVTLIAVTSIKIQEHISALMHSMRGIKFAETKLVTSEEVVSQMPGIKIEKCRKLDYVDYSRFCIYDLYKHVDTDFCMLIHHDGFVVRPDKWEESFLDYDYIGAPWPVKNDAYISPFGEHIRVGNGGFTIRSKKLLNVPNHHDVVFEVNTGDFYKHMNAGSYNEDGCICVHNKHVYEAAGCKFAPVALAARFSQETQVPETEGIYSFGFHKHLKL